jgi:hypothetical protein
MKNGRICMGGFVRYHSATVTSKLMYCLLYSILLRVSFEKVNNIIIPCCSSELLCLV